MILQGGAQILTEAVTKSNRLEKCRTINGGVVFIYCGCFVDGSYHLSQTVNFVQENDHQ
jgi:hypothetical protein